MSANEVVAKQETGPGRDERVASAIAHAIVIGFGMGMVGATVMWLMQKDKSKYVAFQTLQAAVYQFAGFLVYLIGMVAWGCCYAASFIPLMANADKYKSGPPWFFFVSLALLIVPLGLIGLWMLYGLWGAVRTLQGRDFKYVVLGSWLERYLAGEEPAGRESA